MDKQFLLKQFRLGFKSVKDKKTGKVYYATGDLAKKISRLNYYGLIMVGVNSVLLINTTLNNPALKFVVVIGYFFAMTALFFWLGKRIIVLDDLKDIVEK